MKIPMRATHGFTSAIDRFFHSEFDIGEFRDREPRGRTRSVQPVRRRDHGRFRRRRPAGRRRHRHRSDRADGFLSKQRRRHIQGSDRTRPGITDQLGGLVCYQADYDNDGRLDIFIPRGAWLDWPIRPTLLRNNGAGGFTDVTRRSRIARSGELEWGRLGRFRQRRVDRPVRRLRAPAQPPLSQPRRRHVRGSRRQRGRRRASPAAGPRAAPGSTTTTTAIQDLFVNNLEDTGRLYHNERDGRFTEVDTGNGYRWPETRFCLLGLGFRQRRLARHLR